MRIIVVFCIAAIALAILPEPAFAKDTCEFTMWAQAPDLQEGMDMESQWNPDDLLNDIIKADNWFSLDGHRVVAIRWWGSYFNNIKCEPNFYINIYDNNDMATPGNPVDDVPGTPLKGYSIAYTDIDETFYGTDSFNEDVYMYWLDLKPLPGYQFCVEKDKKYWISIVADGTGGCANSLWGWHSALNMPAYPGTSNAVTGVSDDLAFWAEGKPDSWEHIDYNMAFVLTTNACIPEPGAFVMVGMGVIGLIVLRRRKR